jgi:hypothetical protein
MQELTQTELKEILHYNPETGEFNWIESKQGRKLNGFVGTIDKTNGYLRIKTNNKRYYAHRLAFLWMTGSFPIKQTDHRNHNRLDNRWINLRTVSRQENQRNRSLNSNNKSGFVGVSWHKHANKWVAQIRINGKLKYLGLFTDLAEAIDTRKKANIKYGYHKNHGT